MKRQPELLNSKEFDVVIIGGGIYGACMAWEAVTRGLSVALLERNDFGWATSANMHRILHGGFRYLRNADFKRIRESVRERNTLMRLAPHLTGPLPFLVPTSRAGIHHKEILRWAIWLYDACSLDRNHGIDDSERRIPRGHLVSRGECLRLAPGLDPKGITGGAIWYDASLHDPARLVLEFIHSAHNLGAAVVNYVEATGFLRKGASIRGVAARDTLSGDRFDVLGRMVIDCSGPWTNRTVGLQGMKPPRPKRYVRSVDVVVPPLTQANHGLALMGPQDGTKGHMIRYFAAPWRGMSVAGSVDYLTDTDPDAFQIHPEEIDHLVGVLRQTLPGADLGVDDVLAVQAGLIPHDDTAPFDDPYNAARHYSIVDHGLVHGAEGLISVTGIKYTTARDIAQKTTDHVLKRLDAPWFPSSSAHVPLHGGKVEHLEAYRHQAVMDHPQVDRELVEAVVDTHGSAHGEVLALVTAEPAWGVPLSTQPLVYPAQIVYAVRNEMAQKLTDVVVRRTRLASERHPGAKALAAASVLMASLLGWSEMRLELELRETREYLERFWVRPKSS